MAQTTFRSDVVAAIMTVLTAQKTATPTQLRAVYAARPGSFPETPCAYVGPRSETITYSAHTVERRLSGLEVIVVDTFTDASETATRMDDLVDLLVERFWGQYNAVAGGHSIVQLNSVSDTEVEVSGDAGSAVYRGAVLTFGDTFDRTGRL